MSDASPNTETVGLRQYLQVVYRRKLIVLGVLVLAVAISALLTFREQSVYKAETTIVVGQGSTILQIQNANGFQPLSATMKELIKSSDLAGQVIGDLHLRLTPSQLLSKVSVSFNPDSAALDVSVTDHVPTQAEAIADRIGARFTTLVAQRFDQGSTGGAGSPSLRAVVWDPAHVVPGRVSPTPVKNLLIAGALGLVLGLLGAFVRDHFDRSLRTLDEIEAALGVPVIGQIPSLPKGAKERPRMLWDDNGEFAEAFRGLRANLQYLAVRRPLRSILVTSPSADQGKTTVCANLATALAQSGASVALLEADLRRPQLAAAFGLPPTGPGLTSVLIGTTKLARATHEIKLPDLKAAGPDEGSVTVLPSGPLPPNPSELVASPGMHRLIEGFADVFDIIIIDSPPLLPVADSLGLAKLVDGVIVVVRSGSAGRDEARDVRALVERLELPLLGVVVSDLALRRGYGGYQSYSSRHEAAPNGASGEEGKVRQLRETVDAEADPVARAAASSDS